jgi:protein-S-isoprenylcysteine O-methyltransferase Ste14
MSRSGASGKKLAAFGAIGVFFIMAFEVLIMISPFAFFFYSVFNPIFHFLSQYSLTKWTTNFFLPHMILPPTFFLGSLRILGSILFLAGLAAFTVCALQVYLGKIFKWGVANRGLYRVIRHPQYLALGIWGIGMAILWPRFIVLVTLSLMFILYYFLARDEERRMLGQYGEAYERYMAATGRFVPQALERPITGLLHRLMPSAPLRHAVIPVLIVTVVIGTGFLLRSLTLNSLPMAVQANLTVVPILPEDGAAGAEALKSLQQAAADGAIPFLKNDRSYLGYLMPADYIMQGMIADTGGHFHLFKKHKTLALITDWVLHPFEHLRRPPAAHMAAEHGVDLQAARRHHCPLQINLAGMDCDTCTYRRIIWVEADSSPAAPLAGIQTLSLNTRRTPVGYTDVNLKTGEIINRVTVGKATAWKDVPTPEI